MSNSQDSQNRSVLYVSATIALLFVAFSMFLPAQMGKALGMLTSGGDMNPSKKLRGFWGIAQGAVTIMLILVGGTAALKTLQTASIAAAFPFMLVMLVMCYSIYKALSEESV